MTDDDSKPLHTVTHTRSHWKHQEGGRARMFNDLRRYEAMRTRFANLADAHCEVQVSPAGRVQPFRMSRKSEASSCPPHLSMRVQGDWGFELCYDDNGCLNVANNIGAVLAHQ